MSRTLPDRVAGLYYAHGLFCSSHPYIMISIAISTVFLCCLPLINLPVPGAVPKIIISNSTGALNESESPLLYVQQVSLRSAVIPWASDLSLSDGFRGPLYEVFNLLEIIQNYQDPDSKKSLSQVCLHIEAVKKKEAKNSSVLPEYNCLILSPANFWQQSVEAFTQDANIIGTIFSNQGLQKGKISTFEMLFGMSLKETGIKRHPLRTRQRIVQYAVTLFWKEYDPVYVKGLKHRLATFYPLHQLTESQAQNSSYNDETLYIFYPSEFNNSDFFPLTMTFIVLFFYVYFSVRKIELIQSKIGIAVSATVTVIASLLTSVGACFFFGLTLTLSGREIFPYLIVIVGLENVLVLTKSVVSTPVHLDMKIRVAQGLSREGWSITKNLLVEVTILTIGLVTFVPAIQEICIFGIVGLISDFYLQMVFFSTTLAIDIRKTELLTQNDKHLLHNMYLKKQQQTSANKNPTIYRSKSHPKLDGIVPASHGSNVIALNNHNALTLVKIPKRLKVVHFWARTRIFQRAFMVWMVVWISMIIYNSEIIKHMIHLEVSKPGSKIERYNVDRSLGSEKYIKMKKMRLITPPRISSEQKSLQDYSKLRPANFPPWNRLSPNHWSSILLSYNLSMAGERIMILPTIKLSHAISPQFARQISNPNDMQRYRWESLASAAFDPLDFSDMEISLKSESRSFNTDTPFIPSSPMEIFLATVLCLISVVVVAYTLVVLYRCICSRNYPEWRASWSFSREKSRNDSTLQFIIQEVSLILEGHMQEIEFIVSDGNKVASSCLAGDIKIWELSSGEQLMHIDRKKSLEHRTKSMSQTNEFRDEIRSDYTNGAASGDFSNSSDGLQIIQQNKLSPSNDYYVIESANPDLTKQSLSPSFELPDLRPSIYTKFSSKEFLTNRKNHRKSENFDFGTQFEQLFKNHCKLSDQRQNTFRSLNNKSLEDSFSKLDQTDLTSSINLTMNEKSPVLQEISPIWCIDFQDNLIVIGCANGSLEFWEGTTGEFKCIFDDGSGIGISAVKLIEKKVIVAKLDGSLDFLFLETDCERQKVDWGFNVFRRTHVRTGSAGSPMNFQHISQSEDLRCIKIGSCRAHQQAITVLDIEGGRILTGSQDHTLKVYRLQDHLLLYTLHGHCGPITCLFIDRISPMTSGSGSQDGLLCVWDLSTGTCVYSIQAHNGAIAAITCSASYVISIGVDEKLCVWERFQGHLLHALSAHRGAYSLQLAMLTHNLLITSNQGSLIVWDVRTGEPIREVRLGHKDSSIFIKQLLPLPDGIICDFGRQLRIIRFPFISNKID